MDRIYHSFINFSIRLIPNRIQKLSITHSGLLSATVAILLSLFIAGAAHESSMKQGELNWKASHPIPQHILINNFLGLDFKNAPPPISQKILRSLPSMTTESIWIDQQANWIVIPNEIKSQLSYVLGTSNVLNSKNSKTFNPQWNRYDSSYESLSAAVKQIQELHNKNRVLSLKRNPDPYQIRY